MVMLGANMALQFGLPWQVPKFAMLLMQIVMGATTYLATLVALDKQSLVSSLQMFRRKRPAAA
jgi:hypothetical protein